MMSTTKEECSSNIMSIIKEARENPTPEILRELEKIIPEAVEEIKIPGMEDQQLFNLNESAINEFLKGRDEAAEGGRISYAMGTDEKVEMASGIEGIPININPQGVKELDFRKTGGFHAKYSERYKNSHYGMLHIQDVPNFTYILIHTGNTDEHTSGCLIVGETQQDLDSSKDGFIGSSTVAYKKMYAKVANQLLQGKKVSIEYTTIDKLLDKPAEESDVYEKLQEISGEIKVLNAKLSGRNIT